MAELYLGDADIGDQGMEHLADGLKQNQVHDRGSSTPMCTPDTIPLDSEVIESVRQHGNATRRAVFERFFEGQSGKSSFFIQSSLFHSYLRLDYRV